MLSLSCPFLCRSMYKGLYGILTLFKELGHLSMSRSGKRQQAIIPVLPSKPRKVYVHEPIILALSLAKVSINSC